MQLLSFNVCLSCFGLAVAQKIVAVTVLYSCVVLCRVVSCRVVSLDDNDGI